MCDAMKEILLENKTLCDTMMEVLQDRIDAISQKARENGFYLAKMVFRMNADGSDYETIAAKCLLTVEEVKDILSF